MPPLAFYSSDPVYPMGNATKTSPKYEFYFGHGQRVFQITLNKPLRHLNKV